MDSGATTADHVNFSLEFAPSSDEARESALEALRAGGAEVQLEEGRALVVLIAGAIALVTLINLLIDLQRRLTRHGVIVNAFDPRNIEVKEDSGLEYGIIVTVDAHGNTQEFDQRKNPVGVETILKSLTGGS
jgi:hypothetical protein